MADEEIGLMPSLAAAASGDLLAVVDISEPLDADKNKSVTFTVMETYFNANLNFNNYSHPGYTARTESIDTGLLTGATVISDLDFNLSSDTSGHITAADWTTIATREFAHADLASIVANEHIDWTSTTENFLTTGTLNCGLFTSVGIDDNATAVQLTISDSTAIFEDQVIFENTILTVKNGFYAGASSATFPRLQFDSFDHIEYDRTTNQFIFTVGSGTQFTLNATTADFQDNNVTTTGHITGNTITLSGGLVKSDTNTDFMIISGGNGSTSGANILLNSSGETPAYDMYFRSDTVTELQFTYASNLWDFKTNEIRTDNVLRLKERAASQTDVTDHGQIWVKTGAPSELWFTRDNGTETQLDAESGGGGLTATYKTASYTAVAGDFVLMNLGGVARTVTLPATIAAGDRIAIHCFNTSATVVKLTVGRNAKTIRYRGDTNGYAGGAADDILVSDGETIELIASDTSNWEIV